MRRPYPAVSPRLRGDAAAHSLEAARERPARQDRGGLTGSRQEPAAMVPHLMMTAPPFGAHPRHR